MAKEAIGVFQKQSGFFSEIENERQELIKRITEQKTTFSLWESNGELPEYITKDVIANGSSYGSINIVGNSDRPFLWESRGITQTKFVLIQFPLGFLFRQYCPWAHLVIRKSDQVQFACVFYYSLMKRTNQFQMVQAGIYVKIIYDFVVTPRETV